MLRALTLTSVFCTFLSLIVHAATFFGYAFYPAVFMVLLLFVLWPMIVWQWRLIPKRNLVLEIFGAVPVWMKVTLGLLILYPFVNAYLCHSANLGGNPVQLADKRYVLQSGEQVLRVLTPEEFQTARAVQIRMLSGHLLGFYGVAVIALRAFWIKSGTYMADAKIGKSRPSTAPISDSSGRG
jgi:hypothetical protein